MTNKCYFRFDKGVCADSDEKKLFKSVAQKVVNAVIRSDAAKNIFEAVVENDIKGFNANIIFTNDDSIHKINLEHRGIDRATDVLSFPINDFEYGNGEIDMQNIDEDLNMLILGDIIISVSTMKRQAEDYGHSIERECAFLTCHSMLHLLGYDHMNESDEKQMMSYTENILNKIGFTR